MINKVLAMDQKVIDSGSGFRGTIRAICKSKIKCNQAYVVNRDPFGKVVGAWWIDVNRLIVNQ